MSALAVSLMAAGCVAVGAALFWLGRYSMWGALRDAQRLARVDCLTGLLNRRAFDERLSAWRAVEKRYSLSFSLVLIDMDGFKSLNDREGHPAGDAALRDAGERIRSLVRDADEVFRIGGDEFAVLCPATSAKGALVLAERLCAHFRERGLSLSVGIANASDEGDLVERADAALLAGKRAGGNRATAAP